MRLRVLLLLRFRRFLQLARARSLRIWFRDRVSNSQLELGDLCSYARRRSFRCEIGYGAIFRLDVRYFVWMRDLLNGCMQH